MDALLIQSVLQTAGAVLGWLLALGLGLVLSFLWGRFVLSRLTWIVLFFRGMVSQRTATRAEIRRR